MCGHFECNIMSQGVMAQCGMKCGLCRIEPSTAPSTSEPSPAPTTADPTPHPTPQPTPRPSKTPTPTPTTAAPTPLSVACDTVADMATCERYLELGFVTCDDAYVQAQCPVRCGLCTTTTASTPTTPETTSTSTTPEVETADPCFDENPVLCGGMLSRCDETAIMMFCPKTCGVCSGATAGGNDGELPTVLPTAELGLQEHDQAAATGSRGTSDTMDTLTIGICIAAALMVIGICIASVAFYKNAGKTAPAKKPIYGFRENYRDNPILDLGPRGNHSDLDDLAWEAEDSSSVATSQHRPQGNGPRYSNQFENLCQNLQALDSSNSESSADGVKRVNRQKKLERQKRDRAAAAVFDKNAGIRDAFVNFMNKLNMEIPSASSSEVDAMNSQGDNASESTTNTAIKSASSATSYNSRQQAQIAAMVANGMSGGMTQQQFEAMAFAQQQQQQQPPRGFSPSTGSYVEIVPGSGSPAPLRSILRNSPRPTNFERPQSGVVPSSGQIPGRSDTLQMRHPSRVEWNLPATSPKGWQHEGLRQHHHTEAAAMAVVSPDTSYLVPSRSDGQPQYEEPHPGTHDDGTVDDDDDFADRVYDNFSILMPSHDHDPTSPGAASYHVVDTI